MDIVSWKLQQKHSAQLLKRSLWDMTPFSCKVPCVSEDTFPAPCPAVIDLARHETLVAFDFINTKLLNYGFAVKLHQHNVLS